MPWKVRISKSAAKKAERLPAAAKKVLHLLWCDLQEQGPAQPAWPHYGKL